jgi:hypothetical protein
VLNQLVGSSGNLKQTMASTAGELGSIPSEKTLGGMAQSGGVAEQAEADGAPAALIANGPAETEETELEPGDPLYALRGRRRKCGRQVGKVKRDEKDRRKKQGDLGREKAPATKPGEPGQTRRSELVLTE